MRSSSVVAASLLALGFFGSLQSCSAGGSTGDPSSVTNDNSGQAPILPNKPGQSGGSPTNGGSFMVDDQTLIDANGRPINVGTELACDGIDENNNGITDDVDKGKDGLCDCLHIGFLGELASDAGNATGAFESWLNARSDVPVKHIGARDILTPDVLKDLQVLVVGNLRQRGNSGYSAAELEAFRQWIEVDGGGVISLAGYSANENDMVPTVALLQPTGLSYDYKTRGPGVLLTGAPPMIANDFLAPGHPTLDGIVALGVYAAYPVVGDGTVLLREGGFDLAMAKELGAGHVYAFSDEWITQDLLWGSQLMLQQTPCQQQCNQCKNNTCTNCARQCSDCQMQPCQGGQQVVPDGGTCVRGCDQGCTQCSNQCTTCEQTCTACTALEGNRTLDIPRFWLNVLRWLTPANECQVPVPPTIVY